MSIHSSLGIKYSTVLNKLSYLTCIKYGERFQMIKQKTFSHEFLIAFYLLKKIKCMSEDKKVIFMIPHEMIRAGMGAI
jgi:hypothetical protein